MYRVRDFIETKDGLIFSVLLYNHPISGIVSQLRYRRENGNFHKFGSSDESRRYLQKHAPNYVHFRPEFDRKLTIVPRSAIKRHYIPGPALENLIERGKAPIVSEIVSIIISESNLSLDDMGITGSYLIGAQNTSSDVDLVVYGLDNLSKAVCSVKRAIGEDRIAALGRTDWKEIYSKRGIEANEDYSFPEFVWHETRKFNRAKLGDVRFDLLSCRKPHEISESFGDLGYNRIGDARAECVVRDANRAYDYPAVYKVEKCEYSGIEISEIVSYTHTYVGQARRGEMVRCKGILERVSGKRSYHRILVGSSREAPNEFLKSLRYHQAKSSRSPSSNSPE